MSQVLNSSTSRSSDHGSLTVLTPGKSSGSPLPLTRSSKSCREASLASDAPSDFIYVAVVGVPIQPMTSRAPAGRGVALGAQTEVSTHVGSTVTAGLYCRAYEARYSLPASTAALRRMIAGTFCGYLSDSTNRFASLLFGRKIASSKS